MKVSKALLAALLIQAPSAFGQQPQPAPCRQLTPASASVEGAVTRLGTNEAISDVDVELVRIEGTACAPMDPAVAAQLAQALVSGAFRLGLAPPTEVVPEIKYVRTTNDGRFIFRDLKEGTYRLKAAPAAVGAYFPIQYGQRDLRGPGVNLPIAAGQAIKDIKLELTPPGVITGRVFDADGEPLGHVAVMAITPTYKDGRRIWSIGETEYTDERGDYRLHQIPPGVYYVAAKAIDPRRRTLGGVGSPVVTRRVLPSGETVEETDTLVYNGGALAPDQSNPINVRPGSTISAVDIPMTAARVQSHHIRGTAIDSATRQVGVTYGPQNQPATIEVRAILLQQASPVAHVLSIRTNDGTFDLLGAVPGRYVVTATTLWSSPGAAAAPNLLGSGIVDVGNSDADNVKIAMEPGFNLPGRIAFQDRLPVGNDPALTRLRISVTRDPAIVGMPDAMPPGSYGGVAANGAFTLLPTLGDFRVTVTGLPPDIYVRSIHVGPVDILDGGLHVTGAIDATIDIVLDDGGELTGTVVNDKLEPIPNVIVALVPGLPAARRRFDLYKSTTTDASGKFRLQGISPGSYSMFSWEYADPNSWQDPQFLQPYESLGKGVFVQQRNKQDIQLTVIPKRQ